MPHYWPPSQVSRPRGITSLEASVARDSRDRYKRAKQMGYENVEDRYASDETFCDRVHEDGRGLADCIFDDMMVRTCQIRFAPGLKYRLASPPIPKTPTSSPSRSTFMSQPAGVGGYPFEFKQTWTKVWGFMFGRHVFSEKEYIEYVCKKNSHRQLLTWAGIVNVPTDGTQAFLENLYERNLPLVRENLNRKQKQSVAAKSDSQFERKRKADEEAAQSIRIKLRASGGLIRYRAISDARASNAKERSKTFLGARSTTDFQGIQLRSP